MAQVMQQMPDYDIAIYDCSTNPEILLLMAEQDEAECDAVESTWLAGLAITKPQQHD
jgi:hypothetical protein